LREGDIEIHLRVGIIYTLFGAVWAGDLLSLSRELPKPEVEAQRFPGWIPWRHYARGAHHALRAELSSACAEYEAGLRLVTPGEHQAWWPLAAAHLQVLVDLGQYERAGRVSRELTTTAAALGIEPYDTIAFEIALAMAEAHDARLVQAVVRIERALASAVCEGRQGLGLGMLHEAMARLALLSDDEARFATHVRLMGDCYQRLRRPGLLARYERLVHTSRPSPALVSAEPEQPIGSVTATVTQ
jgi:hypothetical protein